MTCIAITANTRPIWQPFFDGVRTRPRDAWLDWYGWALPVAISPEVAAANARLGTRWASEPYAEFAQKIGRLLLPVEQTFDARTADHAVERLKNLDARPFMLTCSFNYPHDPNVVPSPYYESVSPDAIELPASFGVREPSVEDHWARRVARDLGDAAVREYLRIYYASCMLVDDQVGRVLEALDTSGRARDTIVIFTADHGDMTGNHGMVLKGGFFYDELMRVPMIVRYPPKLPPGRSRLSCSLADLMPTILSLTEQPIPEHVQGIDLSPWLVGERRTPQPPQYSFGEIVSPHPEHRRAVEPGRKAHFMVRGQGYKYARYADGEEWLFDLNGDPRETHNLASVPAYADQREALSHRLDEWLEETSFP